MAARSRVKPSGSGLGPIQKNVAQLVRTRLLVGIPGDSAARPATPGSKSTPPSNAVIGYLMEHGDDEMHLPPRPFLVPGVRDALPEITKGMHRAVMGALSGKPTEIKDGFDQAGLAAKVSVKARMQAGPFAPLSVRTIEARARRRNPETGKLLGDGRSKSARDYLKLQSQGTPDWALQGAGLAKPLLDTFSLYGSIQYVVKQR